MDGIIRTMRFGKRGVAYNIGNPSNKTTILNLAHKVIEIVASPSSIVFVDPRTIWGPLFEEANDKYPDADKAVRELGWCPQYSLEDTIKEATKYIREGRRD